MMMMMMMMMMAMNLDDNDDDHEVGVCSFAALASVTLSKQHHRPCCRTHLFSSSQALITQVTM